MVWRIGSRILALDRVYKATVVVASASSDTGQTGRAAGEIASRQPSGHWAFETSRLVNRRIAATEPVHWSYSAEWKFDAHPHQDEDAARLMTIQWTHVPAFDV